MCGGGSRRASAASVRAWMPPIQAWKSLSMIFIGSRLRGRVGEGLQHLALEHLDLLLRDFQLLLAEARQLEAAPVDGERFLKRQLAALHSRHDFFQLGERPPEGGPRLKACSSFSKILFF